MIYTPQHSEAPPKIDFNVLLLDDSPSDLLAVERALEDVPDKLYHINSFAIFDDALSYLELHQDEIDICLVDYSMGKNTAFDFIRAIEERNISPHPIIVMTGKTQAKLDLELMKVGVQDYWDKSLLNSETLARCLSYAHHRHKNLQHKFKESENKTRHIAHINHELKTPLNSIAGLTRMLERLWDKRDERSLERITFCFESIKSSTILLSRLIDELLDFSEIEAGNFQLNLTTFELNSLIRQCIEQFKPLAEEDALKIVAEIPENIIKIYADEQRIYQIVNNLISNAIKYTEKGTITVTVEPFNLSSQPWVRLRVIDTGIGISPDKHAEVFSEYVKVHALLSKSVNSTGLGLPITKRLVDLHKGTISLESKPGDGSSFIVELPCSGEPHSDKQG